MTARAKRFSIVLALGVFRTVASELRSFTTPPRLTLPPAAGDWKIVDSPDCSRSDAKRWPGTTGARQICTARYGGPSEMTLTLYDLPGWPGPVAFGAFQRWRNQPGATAFYKGGIFGVVETPDADHDAFERFIIAIEATLPASGAEGRW